MPKKITQGGAPPSRTPAKKPTSSDSKIFFDNDPQDVIDAPERPVWSAQDLEDDEKETNEESMSLTITMKLAHELSLLKMYLESYEQFNIHLGDLVSGPRHSGLLLNIFSTVRRLEHHATTLSDLRDEKQRGTLDPSVMEIVALKIADKCNVRSPNLWTIMMEKVNMLDEAQRAAWLVKKKAESDNLIGGVTTLLKDLGPEEEWKAREVREVWDLKRKWEQRWEVYGAMSKEDLLQAGWILDVGK